jgi:hypothetical protein
MLVAVVSAACQAAPANRADAAVPSARPSALAATPTAPVIPTLTPVSSGGSGGVMVVVLPTSTLAPTLRRVLLTVPTIA